MALITNPIVNSYKRLVPGYEAPTELTWTKNNQNSLVRIPGSRGMETRIELRSPDAAANPYLVFAVCLAAGLDGINKKIYPTKSSSRELSETDQKTMKIENLPGNLNEAIDYFEQSDWIKEVLGTEFCKRIRSSQEKRMAALYKRNFSLGNRGILIQNLTESNKSPVEIVKSNKQWTETQAVTEIGVAEL